MATYKKRGYKPKTKVEKDELAEQGSTTAEVFNTLDDSVKTTEDWVVKNQQYIFIIVGVVAVLVLGSLGYGKYIKEPLEQTAMNDMFTAQQYFDEAVNGTSKDSLFNMALIGGEGKYGFVDISEQYSGTNAGNLANYYAGVSYLNLKDYANAIAYLSEFSSDDDILGPLAKGAIGDAFVQLEQMEDAFDYYVKAANLKTNDYTTPMFLYKAGVIGLELDKISESLRFFNIIKSDFDGSEEAKEIDLFIGKAEALLN
jgi:tetratricopeptide (TPR) repeat protein